MSTTSLLSRFNAEKNAFSRLKKLCESKVVRWDYWEVPKWYWDPEHFLDLCYAVKRVSREKAAFGYGYDKESRVVVIHWFDGLNLGKVDVMEFLRYSGNTIVGSEFRPEAVYENNRVAGSDWAAGSILADVFEATLSEGRIVRIEHLMENMPTWDWKTVEWERDRVAKVAYGFRGRKPHREIIYDKTGAVVDEIDLSKPIKRKPLPKGVTMTTLAKEIRDRLAKVVVQTVTKAKIKEPAYCLALNYDCEGNPLLLPELGIGLESNRRTLLKRGGRDAKLDIWDAINFPMFGSSRTALMGRDKKLDRACD